MDIKQQIIIYSSIIILISAILFYTIKKKSILHRKKPYILCTTTIIADTVKNIGQDTLEIITLMGPGIDPHLYKPIESDMFKIAYADIIFYNGLHLEAKLSDLLQLIEKNQTTIAVCKDIPKHMLLSISDFEHIFDPHIWFDIKLWIIAIKTISNTLIEKYPLHTKFFEKNTKNYIEELEKLLIKTHQIITKIPLHKRCIITGHDAFSYFARQYNCSILSLQGINTESSPGIYDLKKVIDYICKNSIPAIFFESSIPIKNILAIQEGVAAQNKNVKLGGEIFSDALGSQDSPASTYIDMILHNVTTITNALIAPS